MSRTYHHGGKAKMRLFEFVKWGESWYDAPKNAKPKRARHVANWNWMSTPGHWVHDMMAVKQRAQVRAKLGQTMKLKDLEDAPLFPLAKKPHVYYW